VIETQFTDGLRKTHEGRKGEKTGGGGTEVTENARRATKKVIRFYLEGKVGGSRAGEKQNCTRTFDREGASIEEKGHPWQKSVRKTFWERVIVERKS